MFIAWHSEGPGGVHPLSEAEVRDLHIQRQPDLPRVPTYPGPNTTHPFYRRPIPELKPGQRATVVSRSKRTVFV
jgi:hypothetical protein